MTASRELCSELMDDPALDTGHHRAALVGLARLNRLSKASAPIAECILSAGLPRELTLLDVATGSGDVALQTVRRLQRAAFTPRVILTDISAFALEQAAARIRGEGIEVQTRICDAAGEQLPPCDIAMCSLFFHHLEDSNTSRVLRAMSEAAQHLCVVSDLERSWLGTQLAWIVPRLVTRSYVVHADAVLSARAAYTINELREIVNGTGIRAPRFKRIYPCRQLLWWTPESDSQQGNGHRNSRPNQSAV